MSQLPSTTPVPAKVVPAASNSAPPLYPKQLRQLLRSGSSTRLLSAALASLLNALLSLLLIGQIQQLIQTPKQALGRSLLQLLLLLAAILLSHLWAGRSISRLGTQALRQLRRNTARAIQAVSAPQLEALGPARLYAAFAEDLPRVGAVFSLLPGLLLNTILSIAGLAYLAYLSWPHLLICLAFLALGLLFAEGLLARGIRHHSQQFRHSMDGFYQHIHALIHGYKEMRLNPGRARYIQEQLLEPCLQAIHQAVRGRDDFTSAYSGWSLSLSLFLLCAVLLSGHWLLPMAPSTMVSYALVLLYLRGPVIAIINNLPHLIAGRVALHSLAALGLPQVQTRCESDHSELIVNKLAWQSLEWRALSYHYPAQAGEYGFRLGPLSLRIERGQVIFITGGNGSGKSTFAKLITGLYPSSSGQILLDDQPQDSQAQAYRHLFSAVFGDYYLFSQVLDHQGHPVDQAWLQEQLQRFQLQGKVQQNQGTWSNTQLSQGQRKRLALIQALAEARPILLLDEWAAEQDPEFRRFFYRELIPQWRAQGKTLIAISHDDQYFDCADRVIALRQGQLVEA